MTYFDNFRVEYISKGVEYILKLMGNKNSIKNIHKIRYFSIGFIDFMCNNKRLKDFTNLFSLNSFMKSDKIILEYF